MLLVAVFGFSSGCSLLLDFGASDEGDGGAGVDGQCMSMDVDAAGAFEPNESLATALVLDTSAPGDFEINPRGDEDYFKFAVIAGQRINVELAFAGCADLDLEIFGPNGALLASSRNGLGLPENISLSVADIQAAGLGDFVVRVFDFNAQFTIGYTLTVTLGS